MKTAFLSVRAASIEHGIPYWLLLEAVRSGRIKTVTLSKRRLIPARAMTLFMAQVNQLNAAAGTNGIPVSTVKRPGGSD